MSLKQEGDRWIAKKLPSKERILEQFRYDAKTGQLIRRKTTAPNAVKGDAIYRRNGRGYVLTTIDGESYRVHRLIWKIHHGEPRRDMSIDHIDGDKENNRIENLRLVKQAENLLNASMRSDNKSGCVGVYWEKRRKKWCARITRKNRDIWLGAFKTKEEAIKSRKLAEIKYGFHPNHGKLAA